MTPPHRRTGRSAGTASPGSSARESSTDPAPGAPAEDVVPPPAPEELEDLLDARDRRQARGRKAAGPTRDPVEAAVPDAPAVDAAPTDPVDG